MPTAAPRRAFRSTWRSGGAADDDDPETILRMDRALERLALQDERAAQVVRLRFYTGLTVEEVAEILEATPRTILRDWAFARAWLYGELTKG
jgi:RNA polymerase sigma factor (sigma-70 family)